MASVHVDERDLTRLVAALNKEADGQELRRDLIAGLRAAVTPAVKVAQQAILSMHSRGWAHAPLRSAVAVSTKVEIHAGARRAGVAAVAHKSGMPRGFHNAPKRLNSHGGWRHPVFGTNRWVSQKGQPGWFDDTMLAATPAVVKAADQALDNVANRIELNTKG